LTPIADVTAGEEGADDTLVLFFPDAVAAFDEGSSATLAVERILNFFSSEKYR
jgi:hypothetical protein